MKINYFRYSKKSKKNKSITSKRVLKAINYKIKYKVQNSNKYKNLINMRSYRSYMNKKKIIHKSKLMICKINLKKLISN